VGSIRVFEGRKCAYKCIDFSEDVTRTRRDTNARERIRAQADCDGVAPILAVVLDPVTHLVDGLLLPLYEESLESFVENQRPGFKLSHLYGILTTLQYLRGLDIIHGDIRERNMVVEKEAEGKVDNFKLKVIDFGEVAPSYKGNSRATAALFSRLLVQVKWDPPAYSALQQAITRLDDGDVQGINDSIVRDMYS
jgi:serine/threonine protein kinase